MSTSDDNNKPPPETDDDGWGEAASELAGDDDAAQPASEAPELEPGPEPGPPPEEVAQSVDDEWSMTAPPAVGGESDADAEEPAPPREAAGEIESGDDEPAREAKPRATGLPEVPEPAPEPELPERDYAAEARRWREELQAAAGVAGAEEAETKRSKKEAKRGGKKPPRPPRSSRLSPRTARIAIGAGALLVLVGVIVALGWFNSRDYYFVCEASQISAERGRGFPPWGTSSLDGPAWKPISIPDNAECEEGKTSDLAELEGWYLDALKKQANGRLASAQPENIDLAEEQIRQALLLTRKPERRDDRKQLERLLADVEYWRAAAQIKQAIATLEQAGAQFDDAAKNQPRHQSDSAAWGAFARAIAEELVRGPPERRPKEDEPVAPGDQPSFTGTGPDSPVEVPDAGPAPLPGVDAQPGIALPPPADAAPPPPDAGLPRGGVLL